MGKGHSKETTVCVVVFYLTSLSLTFYFFCPPHLLFAPFPNREAISEKGVRKQIVSAAAAAAPVAPPPPVVVVARCSLFGIYATELQMA